MIFLWQALLFGTLPVSKCLRKCYRPSQVDPQQESLCSVSLETIGGLVQVRSKEKLHSLIKARRGARSRAQVRAPEHRCSQSGGGRGCFRGFSRAGSAARRSSRESGAAAPDRGAGRSLSAHSLPLPSWTAVLPRSFCAGSTKLKCGARPFHKRNAGLKGWCVASARDPRYEQVKLHQAQREKKVRLYYPDSTITSQELLTGFASDRKVSLSTS